MLLKTLRLKISILLFITVGLLAGYFINGGMSFNIHAQENSHPNNSAAPPPVISVDSEGDKIPTVDRVRQVNAKSFLSEREFVLSLMVIILTAVILILKCVLFLKASRYYPEHILPSFAVIFIIGGSLFLVSSGYSATQIAPVLGLFGTVAGYLIGKRQGEKESQIQPNP